MLRLIMGLGPVAALLIGIVGSGAVMGAGFWAWNTFIDNPQVAAVAFAKAESACTIRVMAAAERAEEAAERRIQQAGDEALAAYRKAAETRERLRVEINTRLEEEIRGYERTLDALGRSCLVNDDDFGVFNRQPAPSD